MARRLEGDPGGLCVGVQLDELDLDAAGAGRGIRLREVKWYTRVHAA